MSAVVIGCVESCRVFRCRAILLYAVVSGGRWFARLRRRMHHLGHFAHGVKIDRVYTQYICLPRAHLIAVWTPASPADLVSPTSRSRRRLPQRRQLDEGARGSRRAHQARERRRASRACCLRKSSSSLSLKSTTSTSRRMNAFSTAC